MKVSGLVIILAFCCNIVYPILVTLYYNKCVSVASDKNRPIGILVPITIAVITTILALYGYVWAFLITIAYDGAVAGMIRYVAY